MRFASSGDGKFIQRIILHKFRGFVHSTFNRTLNIQCADSGDLYTIACKGTDNAPNTLIIDLDTFEETDIRVNDIVSSDHSVLSIANKMSITLDGIQTWTCMLPKYPSVTDVLDLNVSTMKQYIHLHGNDSRIERAYKSDNPFDDEMSKMLHERTQLLVLELHNKRMSAAITHAVSLLGLGPGLTPAGDDFLVGLFTVMNSRDNRDFSHPSFCEEIVLQAKALTNDISYMALAKAAAGQVRESICNLMEALIRGSEEELTGSLRRVLAIGATSGTDIALGMVAGLEMNM